MGYCIISVSINARTLLLHPVPTFKKNMTHSTVLAFVDALTFDGIRLVNGVKLDVQVVSLCEGPLSVYEGLLASPAGTVHEPVIKK
jgi:hypothetical protein